jgi:hypothetical protein
MLQVLQAYDVVSIAIPRSRRRDYSKRLASVKFTLLGAIFELLLISQIMTSTYYVFNDFDLRVRCVLQTGQAVSATVILIILPLSER